MIKKVSKWAVFFLLITAIIVAIIFLLSNSFSWNNLGDIIGFITAIIATIGLYLQIRLSKQEQDSFRQQLVSLLHHAAGITDALFSLENSIDRKQKPLLRASIESVRKSSSQLQMGLIETKVGGKQLSDELDQAYKNWAQLELELRILPLKHFMDQKNTVNLTSETDQISNSDLGNKIT